MPIARANGRGNAPSIRTSTHTGAYSRRCRIQEIVTVTSGTAFFKPKVRLGSRDFGCWLFFRSAGILPAVREAILPARCGRDARRTAAGTAELRLWGAFASYNGKFYGSAHGSLVQR